MGTTAIRRHNRIMTRFVFFPQSASDAKLDAKSLAAAKKVVRERGAIVVRTAAGGMLLEVDAATAAQIARALPGWSYTIERKTTRLPERSPLERAKMAARKV